MVHHDTLPAKGILGLAVPSPTSERPYAAGLLATLARVRGHREPFALTFRIAGAWDYAVKIKKDLCDHRGRQAHGLAVQATRTIWLSAKLAPEARQAVLLHELRHVWGWHVPRPRGEEEQCNFSATFFIGVLDELERNGGLAALIALDVDPAG